MKYYGNDPLTHGSLGAYCPIREPPAYIARGKRVKCLLNGRVYPSVSAAAMAAGVKQPTMSAWIKCGKRWALERQT